MLSSAQRKRVMRFTGVAVVLIMVSAVAGGVYLQRSLGRYVDFRYSILVMIFAVGAPAVVLTAGVRRSPPRPPLLRPAAP
jgi:hypothetical protein